MDWKNRWALNIYIMFLYWLIVIMKNSLLLIYLLQWLICRTSHDVGPFTWRIKFYFLAILPIIKSRFKLDITVWMNIFNTLKDVTSILFRILFYNKIMYTKNQKILRFWMSESTTFIALEENLLKNNFCYHDVYMK